MKILVIELDPRKCQYVVRENNGEMIKFSLEDLDPLNGYLLKYGMKIEYIGHVDYFLSGLDGEDGWSSEEWERM